MKHNHESSNVLIIFNRNIALTGHLLIAGMQHSANTHTSVLAR